MAIDTTMFAGTIAAATYAVGDRIPLGVIRGPKVVRDGYGKANLKRIFTGNNAASTVWAVHVKNSNWVDEMSNVAGFANDVTYLSAQSGAIQAGQDMDLQPNSGWDVYAECIIAGTEAAAADVFALIDIDYPSVAAVQNPKQAKGAPVTVASIYNRTPTAKGTLASAANWATYNIDVLKAGSRYLLTEAAALEPSNNSTGFISISGAAGQAGLERIIPTRTANGGSKYPVDYSTPLVKGPMNLNILSIGPASAVATYVYMDFVKKAM